jgi:hypothetical protein
MNGLPELGQCLLEQVLTPGVQVPTLTGRLAKFVHCQTHVHFKQHVWRQVELRPDVDEYELVVQEAAAGDASQVLVKEFGYLPVQSVGDERLVPGNRHLPKISKNKCWASGWRVEKAHEVCQHPKGHKERQVVTSGR